jgi:hypothetical protein
MTTSVTTSVLEHLQVGRAEWPLSLVPAAAFARMLAATHVIPEPITGVFVECHLADATRTDWGARVSRFDRDEILRRGLCPERWRPFFDLWATAGHPASRIDVVDIEHDMGEQDALPFLCPGFEPELLAGHHAIEERAQRERGAGRCWALKVAPAVLTALDPSLPSVLFDQLERCCQALPPYGVVIPVWPGSSRPGSLPEPSLRVTVSLPRAELEAFLVRVGWKGDWDLAQRFLQIIRPSSPWIGFDTDILPGGVGQRMGLYQEHGWARPWDDELVRLLDHLQDTGLCLPDRLDGLKQWVTERPARPRPGQARSLSLKIVLRGLQRPEVKAYLSTFDEVSASRALRQDSLRNP